VVRSFELDDRNAVVQKPSHVSPSTWSAEEKQRELKDDTSWFERASAARPATKAGRPVLRLIRCDTPEIGTVPIFDLRVAAGAFSEGQNPEPVGYARVQGTPAQAGQFVAQVVGDSMDQIVSKGAWCLWQYLGASGASPAAVGEDIVVRRSDAVDPELGQFTFKRLAETPEGRKLAPMSHNAAHRAILLAPDDDVQGVARLVGVVEEAASSEE
jgi:SOS-response transcriptional repressor LexA